MRQVPIVSALAAALYLVVLPAAADEGMWQPRQLPALSATLAERGLALDPRDLTDLTRHPLNAVIGLGFCTASFVSPQGLIVTNHHCAYGALQYNSTAERDLLTDGFMAATLTDELPADPSLRVYVTDRIEDVTSKVIGNLSAELDGAARHAAIEAAKKSLVARCEAAGDVRCDVYTFHGGLQYQLIRQLEIRDVRLVHAPAGAVGNYGGEIDNFEWPRHTGDYTFMRAYVGPDGKPADHHADNVPYKPQSWLKVAADGVASGDYVMVAGYPGSTSRYRLADEVATAIEWSYPTRIAAFEQMLAIIDRETTERPDAAILYATAVASLKNALKLYRGTLDGFGNMDAVGIKRQGEDALLQWAAANGEQGAEARQALDALRSELAAQQASRDREFWLGQIGNGGLLGTAATLHRLAIERAKPDAERDAGYQDRDAPRHEARLRQFERRYDAQVDRALLAARLQRYAALPPAQRVPELDAWLGLEGDKPTLTGLDTRLDALYAGTKLGDTAERLRWFAADRAAIEASSDPVLQLAVTLQPALQRMEDDQQARDGRLAQLRPRLMQAMIAFREASGQPVYPDANNSLRLTFGQVRGYAPRDGVEYAPFTTLDGIVDKHTGKEPFDAPADQRAAIAAGAGAPYRVEALGDVPVNFLSDVDTTGGNSGSPTLNARGELVGLLFDGNYESLASDWIFNPALTRSIHVDARYMRWMMDHVDQADRLLIEMDLPATP